MIFEGPISEQNYFSQFNMSKIFFFGGRPVRRSGFSPLYELQITWSTSQPSYPISVELKQTLSNNDEPVKFPGGPDFKSTLPNKKYFPNKKKWVFIDDDG